MRHHGRGFSGRRKAGRADFRSSGDPETIDAFPGFDGVRTGIFRFACRGESKDHMLPPSSSSPSRSAAMLPIVALRSVTKTYSNGTLALAGLDLDVRPGEFLSLPGPSGCGKSTALRLIAGLAEPSGGTIAWSGAAAGPPTRHDIGFVFQEPTLMPWAQGDGHAALPVPLGGSLGSAGAQIVAAHV